MNIYLLLFICSVCAQYETTTKTYEIDVPGSEPIKIVEGESLWQNHATTQSTHHKIQHRAIKIHSQSFTTDRTKTNLNNPVDSDENSASENFQPTRLKEFLDSYAEKLKKNKQPDSEENDESDSAAEEENDSASGEEKSKSWDVLNLQKHDHPYEDKKGWVSLEPVPWSISKISKWQSNYKKKPLINSYSQNRPWNSANTEDRPWNDDERPWQDDIIDRYDKPKPQYPSYNKPYDSHFSDNSYKQNNKIGIKDNFDVYYINKPNIHPTLSKPSSVYSQRLQIQSPSYISEPQRPQFNRDPYRDNAYKHDENCNHGDIITDSRAPEFPSPHYESSNRRQGTEFHPDTHPFSGQGDWVLLSTTKGYKFPPQRQRSLKIDPASVGAHRSVRLTVLPPLKNSKVNMTTSHGGMLQVESTFQTVEQAHREYTKKLKMKQKRKKKQPQKVAKPTKPNRVSNSNANRPANRPGTQIRRPQRQMRPTTITANRRNTVPDSSAVLAAVGAGMIPATMAMLVPIALNGRRKRDVLTVTTMPVSKIEMTLTRNQ